MSGRSGQQCPRIEKLQSRVIASLYPTHISRFNFKRVSPPHTKPLLTIRNWDADVRKDMIDALDKLAPEKANYRHNAEGSDDMVTRP